MPHRQAYKDSTVTAIILQRGIIQLHEAERAVEEPAYFLGDDRGFALVAGGEGVVVEGDAVDDGDEEEGPVGAAFGFDDGAAVVDWEEDVGCFGEVGEGFEECARVRGLEEHKGHAGAEEDDVGGFVFGEEFAFEVPVVT